MTRFFAARNPTDANLCAILLVIAFAMFDATVQCSGQSPKLPAVEGTPKEQLRYAGRSFDEWKASLVTDLDPGYRLKALSAMATFGRYGYATEAVEVLQSRAHSSGSVESQAALRALGQVGAPAVGALRSLLREPDFPHPHVVLDALGSIGPDAEPATPDVLRFLDVPNPTVRRAAFIALVRIGRPEPVVVESIRRRVESLAADDRQQPSVPGVSLSELDQSALPKETTDCLFLELISHENQIVRDFSARALASHGSDTPEVVAALEQYVSAQLTGEQPQRIGLHFGDRANNELVFKAAVAALEKLSLSDPKVRSSRLVGTFMDQLRNWYQSAKVRMPGSFGSAGTQPLPNDLLAPFLIRVLESRQDGPVVGLDQRCLELLREIGPDAAAAVPVVTRLQTDLAQIERPNKRRFWKLVTDQTLTAIRAQPAAAKEADDSP